MQWRMTRGGRGGVWLSGGYSRPSSSPRSVLGRGFCGPVPLAGPGSAPGEGGWGDAPSWGRPTHFQTLLLENDEPGACSVFSYKLRYVILYFLDRHQQSQDV